MLVTTEQFRSIYTKVVDYISSSEETRNLSISLGLATNSSRVCGGDAKVVCMEPLTGMDLHPCKNAFQGLACLGSRKSDKYQGSVYVGSMSVAADGSCWEWIKHTANTVQSDKGEESCCDTNDSTASTVASCPVSSMSQRIQLWMECSIIVPSTSCIGITVQNCVLFSPQPVICVPKKQAESSVEAVKGRCPNHTWKSLLFESKGLEWFRNALGGQEETKRLFSQAYTNIQKISKPRSAAICFLSLLNVQCSTWMPRG